MSCLSASISSEGTRGEGSCQIISSIRDAIKKNAYKFVKSIAAICCGLNSQVAICALTTLTVATQDIDLSNAQEIAVIGKVETLGMSARSAVVSPFWRANGESVDSNGQEYDFNVAESVKAYWGNVGVMAPMDRRRCVSTDAKGNFEIRVRSGTRALYVIDREKKNGAIIEIGRDYGGQRLNATLVPLTTVRGRIQRSDREKPLYWTHVYVELKKNDENPATDNRIISCGSFRGDFEFRVPPGLYKLDAYGSSQADDKIDWELESQIEFGISQSSSADVCLGRVDLSPAKPGVREHIEDWKRDGQWIPYTERYGLPAPNWHVTDSAGISATAKISDYRSKWLVLYFWGVDCLPCMSKGIPKIMDFHEKFKNDPRVQVIGIAIDCEGKLKTIDQLNLETQSVREKVWGKPITFPLILDSSWRTWQEYGLPGLGTVLLVDPEGNLVDGDEKKISQILTVPTN